MHSECAALMCKWSMQSQECRSMSLQAPSPLLRRHNIRRSTFKPLITCLLIGPSTSRWCVRHQRHACPMIAAGLMSPRID